MQTFAERLRAEIEYRGLLQKEVADRAGIKKRALDMYVGSQGSMPPADVAVKLAQVLHVSVEYLVTGQQKGMEQPSALYRTLVDDLSVISEDVKQSICMTIHKLAEHERNRSL